jgi:ATP-dependent RNA helicase RhlB
LKFSELTLDSRLQQAIQSLGFDAPTPVQEQAIPHIIEGRDVAGLAQTGTGKTAAFLIPLMERILRSIPSDQALTPEEREKTFKRVFKDWQARNFILVLVPTRELADQVYDNIQKLGTPAGLTGVSIYGGTGYDKQKEGLRNNPQFVIATPGRLIDLYKEHHIDLKQVRAVVFDEADRMFDMGFKDDMVYILHRIPRERQFLVFSATLNFDVLRTAYQFGAEPIEINVSRDQAKAENVKDNIYHLGSDEKPQQLLSLLKMHNPKQAIIFTNFKLNVERIARFLNENGVRAMAISSLLSQAQRTRVMQQFKEANDLNILVATDVAARGLDIQGVDLVINYELPNDPESYVHRIGRTGRAGASGTAISLVSDKDVDGLMRIEEYLKHKVEALYMEDKDLVKEFIPFPSEDFSFRSNDQRPRREGGGGRPQRGGGRGDRPQRGGDRGPRPRPNQNRRGEQRADQGGEGRGGDHRGDQRRDQQGEKRRHPPRHQQNGNGHGKRPQPRQDNRKFEGNRKPRHDQKPKTHPAAMATSKQSPGWGDKVKGFFKKILGT